MTSLASWHDETYFFCRENTMAYLKGERRAIKEQEKNRKEKKNLKRKTFYDFESSSTSLMGIVYYFFLWYFFSFFFFLGVLCSIKYFYTVACSVLLMREFLISHPLTAAPQLVFLNLWGQTTSNLGGKLRGI